MATDQDPRWMEFHVVEEGGYTYFRHGTEVRQPCICADSFWRKAGSDDIELIRGAEKFDLGVVTTTGHTRHYSGMTRIVPELSQRMPADMSGEHLTRLCSDWFCVGDVLRVHYDPRTFFTRRKNLEVLGSFLK